MGVRSLARRAAAVAAILAIAIGNVVACAGWQPAPEARMACCASGERCPMHVSESGGAGSPRVITQVEADTCCAGESNRTQSPAAALAFAIASPALLPVLGSPVVSPAVLALDHWRAADPYPVSPVPKHLLLSVLLI